MRLVEFIFVSFIMGFLTAIPIGAVQLEVAKRSVAGNVRSAIMVAFGAALSDMAYGLLAMFGIAPFLLNKRVDEFLLSTAGVILLVLGVITLLSSTEKKKKNRKTILHSKKASLAIGFSLAITNPPIIFWWIICFEFVRKIGVLPGKSDLFSTMFVILFSSGIFIYLVLLSLMISKLGRNISPKTEKGLNKAMGILLIAFSVYFLLKATGVIRGSLFK